MSAWPVSSCSSRASRRRSSSCASTTRRSASRAIRWERSTATAAREANVSARRRSLSEKRASPGRACRGPRSRRSSRPRATSGTQSPVRAPRPAHDVVVDLGIVEHRVDCARCGRARSTRPLFERDARHRLPRAPPPPRRRPPRTAARRRRPGSSTATRRASSSSRSRRATRSSRRSSVGLRRERVADLVQRLELPRPLRRRLVQPGVLDRDGRLRGEQRDDLLVLLGEVLAARLLGQVEVAVGDARAAGSARRGTCASADGSAGSRPSADPRRGRAAGAASPRGSARRGCRGRAAGRRSRACVSASMPVRDEALELRARCDRSRRAPHTARRSARRPPSRGARRSDVERELGGDRRARLEQRTQPALVRA